MKYKGLIFDFNGVLLWDSHLQEEAWSETSLELRSKPITHEEMHNLHGRPNKNVLEYLVGKELSIEEAQTLTDKKELNYRNKCLARKDEFKLSPGAAELLDFLVKQNIPHTIATSSQKTNVDFFIEHLGLTQWFDPSKITLDDGSMPGKPAPDIYLKAAGQLNLNPKDCVVIEDAKSGIGSAFNAKIGWIVALGPADMAETLSQIQGVNEVVANLGEIRKEKLFNLLVTKD